VDYNKHQFTGNEDDSKFIFHGDTKGDTKYFPDAKQMEIVGMEGDNRLAIVPMVSK
jgi:hypothetical protein